MAKKESVVMAGEVPSESELPPESQLPPETELPPELASEMLPATHPAVIAVRQRAAVLIDAHRLAPIWVVERLSRIEYSRSELFALAQELEQFG